MPDIVKPEVLMNEIGHIRGGVEKLDDRLEKLDCKLDKLEKKIPDKLDERLRSLERTRDKMLGIITFVSAVFSLVLFAVKELWVWVKS